MTKQPKGWKCFSHSKGKKEEGEEGETDLRSVLSNGDMICDPSSGDFEVQSRKTYKSCQIQHVFKIMGGGGENVTPGLLSRVASSQSPDRICLHPSH